ncbi:MAG TPA: ROK family protein [Anaerolineae bacterium]|nr:ROK family protein [Anaerolineae bacterium]
MNLYGGIEAGGTKFVCAVAAGPHDLRAETRFPTTDPAETINRAVTFFKPIVQETPLAAIGLGSFGPVDLAPNSPTYGFITTTPKPGWASTDILGRVQQALGVPLAFDTDVNAAALGEYRWGAARDSDPAIYVTIGTGIGVGIICQGAPLHGLVHPEAGHLLIPHDRERDPFPGSCPFHGDCFEGLASGPALQQRWGQPAETLPADHPAWELEAHTIALALVNLILSFSPQRIVLGGGVMQRDELFPLIRRNIPQLLNGYVQSPQMIDHIDSYIVPPTLRDRAGVLGAVALAKNLIEGPPA